MIATQNETLASLFTLLGIDNDTTNTGLELLTEAESRYLKDLKINVQNGLQYPNLSKKESYLLALAVAANEKNAKLEEAFLRLAEQENATKAELAEIYSCVSLLNVNNVFYRFRHFTGKDYYNQTPAGIKMSVMANPVLGKEFFELVSTAVSALNGCEMCVNAHEASLVHLGTTQARIYDAVRLTAIIKGLSAIL